MDWPIVGAIGGVSILAVAVTVGALAMVRSMPAPATKKAIAMAPLLRFEPHPEVGVLNGSQLASLNPTDYGPGSVPTRAQPPRPEPQAAPARKPPEQKVARPVAPPADQMRPPLAQGPVAAKPALVDPRLAPPKFETPKVDRRYDGVLTLAEISRVKASLRLTPQQEPHWRPVEAVMRDIGRQQTVLIAGG